MKKILTLIFILVVVLLGYYVYQDAERKKKNEVDQLIYGWCFKKYADIK